MAKQVLVISSTLRRNGNSELLAREFYKGALEAGHHVEFVTLQDKAIRFCQGCLACQKMGTCVIRDDAVAITEKMKYADVIAFASPVYYYSMSGQLKTMLDRANALFASDYQFRDIYFLSTAADADPRAADIAIQGIKGWVSCFSKAQFTGAVLGAGVEAPGDIQGNAAMQQAYEMGKGI
ncbi:MAG: flavodoxin family protein [Alistipes senegalensis]|nr:flavodoxin family protein [Oxalobacter formigenes]MCM1281677.1 flavodoxin family protein [Alistipes senegalensis]